MILQFLLRYSTQFGQQIYLISENLPGLSEGKLSMQYHDQDSWIAMIELPDNYDAQINYHYSVRNADGLEIPDGEENRFIKLARRKPTKQISIIDTWNDAGNYKNAYFSKAFRHVLLPHISHKRQATPEKYTHEFRVKAPLLNVHETICLCGSTAHLKNWDEQNPILMTPENNWYVTRICLEENEWPATYKYGIYNLHEKKFVRFEDRGNRLLRNWEVSDGITILHDGFVDIHRDLWRGTGVNIPVFSLRSAKSFGVGEFTDLKLLIDWARKTGIELIQLLPINDTSAQNNWQDSYPYAAISSFALHPLYINLEKTGGKKGSALVKALSRKQKQLNALPDVDYEQVMKFKLSVLHELYDLLKDDLREDKTYFEFFEINRHWLVPYAAFSYLKEKYKTADFNQWKNHSAYDESSIQKLVSPTHKEYDKIAFYYFVQYHLHLQFKEITRYAHKYQVTLKGDIPIGIYRHSCDAWVSPKLFNMDKQAGAPPDDFAATGQNWGFPTYNWEEMRKDDFKWWRDRFDHLSKYFDVFRIDHILGFFRIWSIPLDHIEGIMGKFSPAIPVHIHEFSQHDIPFDYDRFCKPYITQELIEKVFGDNAEEVCKEFLVAEKDGTFQFKEALNTQRKVLQHLQEIDQLSLKDGLFQLLSNVILFEEENSQKQQFHFRFGIHKTYSFQQFDNSIQSKLNRLYNDYFFSRQNYFWKKEAMQKLPQLKRSTRMLVCGEDLGMVPDCVPEVMRELGILSLEVERMPKSHLKEFFHPADASYLSVVTPSTHDTSTLREWWEENPEKTQKFYNQMLGHYGEAPKHCEPWVIKEIIVQHLYSPAMWSIFLLQDLLALDNRLTTDDPAKERINIPAIPNHYWKYRIPVNLEKLLKDSALNEELQKYISESGRLQRK